MVVLGPLSEAVADAAAIFEGIAAKRDEAAGLVTYEQVARWLLPEVRAAVEESWPDGWRRPADTIVHGTEAGYRRHRARRELACDPCALANMRYQHQRHRLDHA